MTNKLKIKPTDGHVYLVRFKDGFLAPLYWSEDTSEWCAVTEGGLQYAEHECEIIKFLYNPEDYEACPHKGNGPDDVVISGNYCATNQKDNWVYFGYERLKDGTKGELVYIGTTMQKPSDRFRWHKHNGKDLIFEVKYKYYSAEDMLDAEAKLIADYRPKLNKKTKRHNDNRRKSTQSLAERRGDPEWCQSCLKRRVNKGYKCCLWCSK